MKSSPAQVRQALLRSIRAIAIGGGLAGAVVLSQFVMEQSRLAADAEIPAEWTLWTKFKARRALVALDPDLQIHLAEDALKDLVKSGRGDSQLSTKSASWLAGYADLLRALALAKIKKGESASAELDAANSIPFGSETLRLETALATYSQTNDPKWLIDAANIASVRPHQTTHVTVTDLESVVVPEYLDPLQAQVYIEIANRLVTSGDTKAALSTWVGIHKALPSALDRDPLCVRPGAAGMIGQLLWKLKHKDEARVWLEKSAVESAKSGTNACRQCAVTAKDLLERTRRL